ncbi:hypothetical protein D3C81_576040 [compost metagenome]
MRTGHRQVITENHPIKAQLATQDVLQPTPREASGLVVNLRVDDMRRHHCRQLPTQAGKRHQVGLAQLFQAALIGGDGHVRIGFGPAMPREMLATRGHTCRIHASDERAGQSRCTQRVTLEGAAAHHGATLVVQVEHRSEAEVQANRQYLGRHQPAALLSQVFSIVVIGQRTHGRQAHKALAQTLYATTFLIHCQDQLGANGADGRAQFAHLARAVDIAGEDDQASHFRLAKQLTVFGGQPFTGDIHHQGALQADSHG